MKMTYNVAPYVVVTTKTTDTGWRNMQLRPVYRTTYNVWELRDKQSNLIRTTEYRTGMSSIKLAHDEYVKAISGVNYLPF